MTRSNVSLTLVRSVRNPRQKPWKPSRAGDAAARCLRMWLEQAQLRVALMEAGMPTQWSREQMENFHGLRREFMKTHMAAYQCCTVLDHCKHAARRERALQEAERLFAALREWRTQMERMMGEPPSHTDRPAPPFALQEKAV